MHGWDLATATAQAVDLDDGLAARMLDWGQQTIRDEFRGDEADGKMFGPQVPVPDDAPVYDRLGGFLGRDPHWSPPSWRRTTSQDRTFAAALLR